MLYFFRERCRPPKNYLLFQFFPSCCFDELFMRAVAKLPTPPPRPFNSFPVAVRRFSENLKSTLFSYLSILSQLLSLMFSPRT
ncbi:MAG: hypothetical protein NZ954_08700 [Thermofilaceae archaeon]|nr:hypothetical protein [Thermofilaceae archaeon]